MRITESQRGNSLQNEAGCGGAKLPRRGLGGIAEILLDVRRQEPGAAEKSPARDRAIGHLALVYIGREGKWESS